MITAASNTQQIVLRRLLDLTGEQERALDAGDIATMNQLSQLRLQTVKEAASFLPPQQPWAPEVQDLAEAVQQSTASLQQQTQACMAAVRRQMAQLNDNRQAARYLAPVAPAYGGGSWKG
jgi:hypothetical protein